MQIQQAHARSIVGSYSDGYEAGKAAANAGERGICPAGSGDAFCAGFYVGWNAAKLGQHLTQP